eukprot:613035-Pyramimonas_sp.AAC.1
MTAPQSSCPPLHYRRGGNKIPTPPTPSPLGTSDIIVGCPACFSQCSRHTVPKSPGPCSDTACVNAASSK